MRYGTNPNRDIQEVKVFPKKKWGQNFLINPQTVQKILLAIEDLKPSMIVEIGPGRGALTEGLLSLKKPFYAVEIDPVLAQYWRGKNVSIIEGSALKVPWQDHLKKGALLTGNLPYNIASRLLVQLCPGPDELNTMVLMFQKEVAHRILSLHKNKTYGILSVLSQCFWETKLLLSAGASDFYPRPKVTGQVLVFKKKKHSISDPKKFLGFVKFCFSQRRKVLFRRLLHGSCINWAGVGQAELAFSLDQGSHQTNVNGMAKKQHIKNLFHKVSIDSSMRAEEISPPQFALLFNELAKSL